MERKYYEINEAAARRSKEMMSFRRAGKTENIFGHQLARRPEAV